MHSGVDHSTTARSKRDVEKTQHQVDSLKRRRHYRGGLQSPGESKLTTGAFRIITSGFFSPLQPVDDASTTKTNDNSGRR